MVSRQYTLFVFLASGFPALLYQIVWQRALFTMFGINVEAVTVVVSGFILGLGIGSLIGGWLSQTRRFHLLVVFGSIEILIGGFGWISLQVFEWASEWTLTSSTSVRTATSILVLMVPTLLMGSTLPILSQH